MEESNVLKIKLVIKSEKLSIHNLEAKPMFELRLNSIKPGLKRSPVNDQTNRFSPIFKILKEKKEFKI